MLLLSLHAITERYTTQVLFITSDFEFYHVTEECNQFPKSSKAAFKYDMQTENKNRGLATELKTKLFSTLMIVKWPNTK